MNLDFLFISIKSPIFKLYEGILTVLLFILMCLCDTICLANRLVFAIPNRNIILSNLNSNNFINISPVMPFFLEAFLNKFENCFSNNPYIYLAFCFSINCKAYSVFFFFIFPCF